MSEFAEYIIVRDSDKSELEKKVTKQLRFGYSCQGGIAVEDCGNLNVYLQAMTRNASKPDA